MLGQPSLAFEQAWILEDCIGRISPVHKQFMLSWEVTCISTWSSPPTADILLGISVSSWTSIYRISWAEESQASRVHSSGIPHWTGCDWRCALGVCLSSRSAISHGNGVWWIWIRRWKPIVLSKLSFYFESATRQRNNIVIHSSSALHIYIIWPIVLHTATNAALHFKEL